MTSYEWVKQNLNIVDSPMGEAIDWGNGVYTTVETFVEMFDLDIQMALNSQTDVRQTIRDNDGGRGFTNLI